MNWEEIGIYPKGKTGKFITTCPKCSGDRKKKNIPCLTVNDEPGNRWWHCNHCTFSGNLDVYEKNQERINKIYQKSRIPQILPELYTKHVLELLSGPKGLSMATLKKRGVYEIPAIPHEPAPCVAFPFKKRGILVNVKFRRLVYDKEITLPDGNVRYLSKNWNLKKEDGAEYTYWGLDHLDWEKSKDLIITEGETDLLTWVEVGMDANANILSVPNGAINEKDVNITDKIAFALDPFVIENVYNKAERVFLATDDDGPGHRLREELSAIIGKDKCFIIKYKGRKDINEVLVGDAGKGFDPLGKKGVIECFEDAYPYPIKGIMTIDHAMDKLERMADSQEQRGFIIGDELVDQFISLKPNLLVTVTGIPSHGKTSWWRWYECKQSIKNGVKWAKFVPDSRPVEREYARIAEIIAGKRWEKNKPWSMSEAQRRMAVDFVRAHYVLVVPDEKNVELIKALQGKNVGAQTLDSLFWYFETLKKQHNIFGYNIDAWNKIDHQRPKDNTEEQYIGRALDSILKFNQNFELMASIIAHPTKLEKKDPNYEPPDLYNIKGSSAWYEKTDIGITAFRKKFEKVKIGMEGKKVIYKWVRNNKFPTDIFINKMKFDELGKEGDFQMYMDWYHAETFVHEMPKYYNSVGDNDTKAEFVKAGLGDAQELQNKIDSALQVPANVGDDLSIDDLPF